MLRISGVEIESLVMCRYCFNGGDNVRLSPGFYDGGKTNKVHKSNFIMFARITFYQVLKVNDDRQIIDFLSRSIFMENVNKSLQTTNK